jgi:serine/threonine protein kinase
VAVLIINLLLSSQITNGFEYLETKKIVHRDICAANILLNRHRLAKISDFGSAINLNSSRDKQVASTVKLRIKWTAPECLTGRNFSSRSDVWSYGVLLWEIFSYGRSPYPRVPIDCIERFILSGDRMKIPDGCTPEMCQVIGSCWKLKAGERPSFKNLKKMVSYLAR